MTHHNHEQFRKTSGTYDPSRADEVQAFIPGPDEHYVLPSGTTKAGAIATTAAAMTLMECKPIEVMVFRKIADQTERVAWHSGERAPMNWRRQCDMARECGISERHFRRIEAQLVKKGLLARATADNGYRGRRSGQPWNSPVQCGLSLEPAIANHAAFVAMVAEAEAIEDQRYEVLLNIRTARRRVRARAATAEDIETRSWAEEAIEDLCGDLPSEVLRGWDLEPLLAHHAALFALEDLIREALTPLPLPDASDKDISAPEASPAPQPESAADEEGEPTGAAEPTDAPHPSQDELEEAPTFIASEPVDNIPEVSVESPCESGAPDSQVRCRIQPQKNLNESCNAQSASISSSADADDTISFASHPDGREVCLENKDRRADQWINPAILQNLDDTALRDLASEDAALYLDAVDDWRDCLPYLLRELGVNVSAWLDAVDLMGEEIAFIALLVIDRNRFHPVTPVLNPGGTLRALTDRAHRGELNLTRAILGIWERDRQGKQPKAGPQPERLS